VLTWAGMASALRRRALPAIRSLVKLSSADTVDGSARSSASRS
jgi:hypothetical protein